MSEFVWKQRNAKISKYFINNWISSVEILIQLFCFLFFGLTYFSLKIFYLKLNVLNFLKFRDFKILNSCFSGFQLLLNFSDHVTMNNVTSQDGGQHEVRWVAVAELSVVFLGRRSLLSKFLWNCRSFHFSENFKDFFFPILASNLRFKVCSCSPENNLTMIHF